MKKKIFTLGLIFTLTGCGINDAINITTAVISKNPSAAFKSIAQSKALGYTINPKRLSNDLEFISSLLDDITSVWGEGNEKLPKEKEYVKYMQNYKSRALIDFDKGIVTVETIDTKNTRRSLTNAIITTLLLPDDPRAVDLFGTSEVKLGATPYLLGEIKDDKNENIRYEWRANRFAEILINKQLKEKTIKKEGKNLTVYYVNIPMVKDHASIRVAKFQPLVNKYARKFNVSKNLINAIIKTESNFNQFAISSAGALGLMQIVPTSAGRDAYKHTKGSSWTPSKEYLFDAKNNIELGSAYIQLLNSKYLNGIYNQVSKEYCVISAYNTGSGNVLKTFSTDNKKAKDLINRKTPSEVYNTLKNKLPYKETRRYLQKVINYKKEFVNL
ncbi:murein transglycosylase domain-containing protein [Arcobacter sp. LA11]|uniref:murein transglycosylase domain-containing protein n=1 Tax=Arcobacter sp. LA11 TaxID=1898176 RepID=UPI0009330EF7|nr:murein transglycosylase domain-containing protein [Arcobacter sp. LA11]